MDVHKDNITACVMTPDGKEIQTFSTKLEGANIKLGSVVSDIMGVSSKDMLRAIADGENDPEKLANFARRTMKKKKKNLN